MFMFFETVIKQVTPLIRYKYINPESFEVQPIQHCSIKYEYVINK